MKIQSYKCPSCGAPIQEGAITCAYCGTKVNIEKDNSVLQDVETKLKDAFKSAQKSFSNVDNEFLVQIIISVILICVLPPVGIIYLIVKLVNYSKKHKEN